MSLTTIATEVHALLLTPADKWSIGDWNRGRMDSPGRYVWVPVSSLFRAPAQASNSATAFPRNLWTHALGIDIHIWGETLDETIAMLHGMMAALRRVTKTELRGVSARWDGAKINDRGFLAILNVEIPLVLTDTALNATGVPGAQTTAHVAAIACDPDPTPPPAGWIDCPCPEDP